MQKLALVLFVFGLGLTACQPTKTEDRTSETTTATTDTATSDQQPVKTEPVKQEPAKPVVTCDSLGIPSYEGLIRELSSLRCESCHGNNLAFNGVKLLTYTDYQTYKDKAKVRIETNMLTKPLDPIEQGYFLSWFENNMPRTEKDCVNKS